MQNYTINIRPKRQATLPKDLLEEIGMDVGDKLEATLGNGNIILTPKRDVALDALSELQKIIKESGVNEEELQKITTDKRRVDV